MSGGGGEDPCHELKHGPRALLSDILSMSIFEMRRPLANLFVFFLFPQRTAGDFTHALRELCAQIPERAG